MYRALTILFFILFLFASCKYRPNRDKPSDRSSANKEVTKRPEKGKDRGRDQKGKNIVTIEEESGVYWIPIEVNDVPMRFIFDTGASDITMSSAEAVFLYKQGKLKDDDFIGVQQYQIADGSISEGAVILLRSVKIGNKTLRNVKASVVDNMQAPLLLGQSALNKFGKISIDYQKKQIIFE